MGTASRRIIASLALLAGVVLSTTPALSQQDESGPVALTVGPVRVEFFDAGPSSNTVVAFVKGGSEGTIRAQMFDAVVGPPGQGWRRVPYGSTPSSLAPYVDYTPDEYPYVPNGQEQQFEWQFTADPTGADKPRYGEFVVTLVPAGEPAPNTAQLNTAVSIQVVAFGAVEPTDLRLDLTDLRVRQRSAWTGVDLLLPDIPGVIGHGPAVLEADGRNIGEVFVDEVTVFEIRRVSPLSLLPWFDVGQHEPILRVSMRPRYTLPDQGFTDSTTSLIPLDGGALVDALPLVGLIQVTGIATGKVGPFEVEPDAITRTYLVFPWSEFLFFVVVYLVQREWRHRNGRKVNMTGTPPPPTIRARVREVFRKMLGRRPIAAPHPVEQARAEEPGPSDGSASPGEDPEPDRPEL